MIENIRLAFQGIWSHKMRSFLTMLGIILVLHLLLQLFLPSRVPVNRSKKI